MNFKKLLKQDFLITILVLVLLGIGSLVIYSTTFNTSNSDLLIKQFILILVGLIAYSFIMLIDIEWIKIISIQLFLYAFIIGMLIYAVFFGSTIAGTNRWIDFGFFAFQPSEYAKILIILFISLIFSSDNLVRKQKILKNYSVFGSKKGKMDKIINKLKTIKDNNDLRAFVFSILYIIPIVVLTFIQPSLGNTIIIVGVSAFTIFFSTRYQNRVAEILLLGVSTLMIILNFVNFNLANASFTVLKEPKSIIILIISFLLFLLLTYLIKQKLIVVGTVVIMTIISLTAIIFTWNNLLGNYQRERLLTFIEGPEADPLGSGYQIIQSKIAIGSGQIFGRGFLQGTQSSLHILTQAHTDFAFASMSEQFGFVGSILLLFIYLILLLRIIKVAKETRSDFGRNLCFGVVGLLLIHIFINIGMNLGKLPVTGIPLPLVSYGGSSVLVILIALGLVQSVNASRRPVDMADSLMLTSLAGNKSE
jgi:rod shape determining protein RodA